MKDVVVQIEIAFPFLTRRTTIVSSLPFKVYEKFIKLFIHSD